MKPFLGDLRIGGDGMKGLAGCGGLSGGLQRQDNQHGFILTFVSAISSKTKSKSLKAGHSVRHVVIDAFWVHLSPDMAIWSDPSWNDQSCCPAQGQRLFDPFVHLLINLLVHTLVLFLAHRLVHPLVPSWNGHSCCPAQGQRLLDPPHGPNLGPAGF